MMWPHYVYLPLHQPFYSDLLDGVIARLCREELLGLGIVLARGVSAKAKPPGPASWKVTARDFYRRADRADRQIIYCIPLGTSTDQMVGIARIARVWQLPVYYGFFF